MAAREPALRLGKRGAKRTPGRRSASSGTLRELPVSNLGREPEQIRTPCGVQTDETSRRIGSKNDTPHSAAPDPAAGPQPGAEGQTAIRQPRPVASPDKASQRSMRGFRRRRPSSECFHSVERCVLTGQVVLPGPYEPTWQPIPRHGAVGRLLVSSWSWPRGSQLDSVRRNSATISARSPTGDSGQSGPSSVPCCNSHQFNVVERPGSTPPEPRQQQSPRHDSVLDDGHRNIHSPASLHEAVQPAEARRNSERLEIRCMPNHGNWLSLAEVELSVLGRQCLNRRFPDCKTLHGEIGVWQDGRNRDGVGAHWRFKAADACIRLRSLCPPIQWRQGGY